MTKIAPHFLRITHGVSHSGDSASVAYLGVSEGLIYLAPFIEEQIFASHDTPQISTTDINVLSSAELKNFDIVILASTRDELLKIPGSHTVSGVMRIHQIVDTSDNLSRLHKIMSSREVKRFESAKKLGFRYEVTQDESKFFEFYDTMHRPTMTYRHGDNARSVKREEAFQSLFKCGLLFRIFMNDKWVAGSVGQIELQNRTLNSRLIGVADGDQLWRDAGAQNFVYHAILDWACGNPSIDRVDFQGCEPFLTKGTFQYKKRFGTRAVIPANVFGALRMEIRTNRITRTARNFLVDNPFLAQDNSGNLVAKYFYDDERPIRIDIPYTSPGIAGMIAFHIDDVFTEVESSK